MDEPSHYGDDLHDLLEMMGSRLRGVSGPEKMLFRNGYNEAYEILEKREDADGEPIGLNIDLIRASTTENPYLDAADVERFKRQYGGTGQEDQALHVDSDTVFHFAGLERLQKRLTAVDSSWIQRARTTPGAGLADCPIGGEPERTSTLHERA